MNIEQLEKIFKSFMKTKDYDFDYNEGRFDDNSLSYFFSKENEPIDIEIRLIIEDKTYLNQTYFYLRSSSGITVMLEFLNNEGSNETPDFVIHNETTEHDIINVLESKFEYIIRSHKMSINNFAVWFLDKFTDKETFEDGNTYYRQHPEELEVIFINAKMYDEYIQWITRSDILYMMPKNVQDIFLF